MRIVCIWTKSFNRSVWGEYYPGKVLQTKQTKAYVTVMLMSCSGWKWTKIEGKLWYSFDDILQEIKVTYYDCKKELYVVKEISR